jgi:predicted amidophosphoribosyltransferase
MAVNQSRTDLVYNWSNNNSFKWIDQECLLCGGINKSNSGICSSCVSDLPKIKTACPLCARTTNTPLPCAGYINNKTKHLNFVCALYRYQYPINFLIQAMKFHNKIIIVKSLGGCSQKKYILRAGLCPSVLFRYHCIDQESDKGAITNHSK